MSDQGFSQLPNLMGHLSIGHFLPGAVALGCQEVKIGMGRRHRQKRRR